jgi:hypothetical protein
MTVFVFFAVIFVVKLAIQLTFKFYQRRDEERDVAEQGNAIPEEYVRHFPSRPQLGDFSRKTHEE